MLKEKPREACAVKALAHGSSVTNGEKPGWRISHLVFGFALVAIVSFMLLYFHYLSSQAAFMLIVFNFMFVSLIFPLKGALATKALMLSVGNMIGLFWNYVFYLFVYALADYFGEFFRILYMIISPFANLIWIVTFYSLSLAFLAKLEIGQIGAGK